MPDSCFSRAKQLANQTGITQYIASPVSNNKVFWILSAFGESMQNTLDLVATVHPDGAGLADSICASADVHALMERPGLEAQQQA